MPETPEIREIASGLVFPEGPVAMPDGTFLVVELRRGTLSRVHRDGRIEVVAELGGGPNGAAIGPDGAAYVCNNGGFNWESIRAASEPPNFQGGWIERVDLGTGESKVLYRRTADHHINGPNDLVFDAEGGFWFTDPGKRREHDCDLGAVYYAHPDGSHISREIFPLLGPNGVGLAPDGSEVYFAETFTGRVWAYELSGPGRVKPDSGRCLAATKHPFDSLAMEADGRVVVAALPQGIMTVRPDGTDVEYWPMPDTSTTNVCFGGDDMRTAYVTLSATGRLVEIDWPRPGLRLPF